VIEFSVIWAGILSGAIYALVGLSYLFVFRATGALSFATGGIAGLAGIAAATSVGLPPLLAALLAVGLAVVASLVLDYLVIRPIQAHDLGQFGTVLALTAALLLIIQVTGLLFTHQAVLGRPLVDGDIDVAGSQITIHGLLAVTTALLATLATVFWLRFGRRGRLLAALGDDRETARLLALPVGSVRLIAVVLGGAAAGLAGVFNAGRAPMDFQTGFDLSIVGFLAIILGGLASAWGPMAGGLLVGLIASIGARLIGATWEQYLLLLAVFIAFAFRPGGIFGTHSAD
jgi:branched-chain amino acid transport system permease protein